MKNIDRVFLIVLDSVGIGELSDADKYGDVGSNTLKACFNSGKLNIPNMQKLGMFNIDGNDYGGKCDNPTGSYARMTEMSRGKDTTIGHWEIAGIISEKPLPTYPDGFPKELIDEFEKKTGRKVLCNKPYSGTQVLLDYGREHEETGALIVYTSADSVWQIAAHEEVVPVEKLYEYCQIARDMLNGEHNVGRVIARPFVGKYPDYTRTSNRHDFSLEPPKDTFLDEIKKSGLSTIAVGKINDIFAGKGISEFVRTKNNSDGMAKSMEYLKKDFKGICFINLVDFDMVYGHRNNVEGYTQALNTVDKELGDFLAGMRENDVLMITADHGCDPSTPSTDHSREYTPLIVTGKNIKENVNLGTRKTFADIGKTICELLGVSSNIAGESFAKEILK